MKMFQKKKLKKKQDPLKKMMLRKLRLSGKIFSLWSITMFLLKAQGARLLVFLTRSFSSN